MIRVFPKTRSFLLSGVGPRCVLRCAEQGVIRQRKPTGGVYRTTRSNEREEPEQSHEAFQQEEAESDGAMSGGASDVGERRRAKE